MQYHLQYCFCCVMCMQYTTQFSGNEYKRSDCGRQIGIVDGDKDDKVFEYKGYSSDEWIINYYANNMDTIMLLREIDVTDIPDNLHSEYEWNINQENKM